MNEYGAPIVTHT